MKFPWLLLPLLTSCSPGDDAWFEEQASQRGLEWKHTAYTEQRFEFPEIMGGGVGLFDSDSDGDLDVLFVDSGDLHGPPLAQSRPRFFLNDGAGNFSDNTERAGFSSGAYGMGIACGDYDNDGDVDVFLTGVGTTVLYRNDGGHFVDVTAASSARVGGWSASAGFWDYDEDGWLDLFVVRYVDWSAEREIDCRSSDDLRDYCSPLRYSAPSSSVLLRNRGDGGFEDVSSRIGLEGARANGLGLATGRIGPRGESAALVANDMLPNLAWVARGEGLVDCAPLAGLAVNSIGFAGSGMGIHAADFDDDGDLDVFVTNLRRQGNALFVQGAPGRFREESARAGLFRPSLPFTGFGCGFADFDCDGYLDLFVANGRVALEQPIADPRTPYAEENQLFRQQVGGRFEEILPRGAARGVSAGSSRALAFGDLDNDGGIDVVVVNQGAPALLLHNRVHGGGQWIGFRILQANGRDAIGARVELTVGGRTRYREVNPVYGYLSSNDPRVHFGLGPASAAERLRVRWSDGVEQDFPVPAVGAYHTLRRSPPNVLDR